MARSRPKNSSRNVWILCGVVSAAGVVGYGLFISPILEPDPSPAKKAETTPEPIVVAEGPSEPVNRPQLASRRPVPVAAVEETSAADPHTEDIKPPQVVPTPTPAPREPLPTSQAESAFSAGQAALEQADWLKARSLLNEAMTLGLEPQKQSAARASLSRISDETIFSARILKDDPFVGVYTVGEGDSLHVIARRYDVTDDFLARINNIKQKNFIRAGQSLKVVQGPFHAVISMRDHTMDVYLQEVFIKRFPVGLGSEGSTPAGEWKIGTKLTNPTYYPPRGGDIIAADDPENPLGEHWLELIGVGGDAVGQQRYGIHGTIEPDSIGRDASLGCVRMHNEDVAEVYTLLITEKSRVIIR